MAAPGSPPLKAPLVDAALYTHTAAPAMVPLPQRPALRTAWQSLELAAAALAEAQYPHRFEGRSPTSLVQAQQEYLTAMRDYQELRAKIYSQGADVKSDRGDYQVLDFEKEHLWQSRPRITTGTHFELDLPIAIRDSLTQMSNTSHREWSASRMALPKSHDAAAFRASSQVGRQYYEALALKGTHFPHDDRWLREIRQSLARCQEKGLTEVWASKMSTQQLQAPDDLLWPHAAFRDGTIAAAKAIKEYAIQRGSLLVADPGLVELVDMTIKSFAHSHPHCAVLLKACVVAQVQTLSTAERISLVAVIATLLPFGLKQPLAAISTPQ